MANKRKCDASKEIWSCVKCEALCCLGQEQELCFLCQDPDCQELPQKDVQCIRCKQMFVDFDISEKTNECFTCVEKRLAEEAAAEEAEEERKNYERQCKCMYCEKQYENTTFMVWSEVGFTGKCINCLDKEIENMLKEEAAEEERRKEEEMERKKAEEERKLEMKEIAFESMMQKLRGDAVNTIKAINKQEWKIRIQKEEEEEKKAAEKATFLKPFKEKLKAAEGKKHNAYMEYGIWNKHRRNWKMKMKFKKYKKEDVEMKITEATEEMKKWTAIYKEAEKEIEEAQKVLEDKEKAFESGQIENEAVVEEDKVIEESKDVENVVVENNNDEVNMVDEIKDIEKMEADKKIAGEAMMEKIRGEVWKEAEKPVESKKVDEIKKDENIVVDNNIDEIKMEAAEEEKMVVEKIKHLKALRAEIDESINDFEKRLEKIKGLKALKEIEKRQEERKVQLNKKDFEIKVVEKIKPVENKVEAVKDDENIIEVKKDDEIKLIDLNKVDENNVEEVVKDLSRECDHQMYLFIKWSSRKSKCPARLQRNKEKAEKAFEKNQFVNLKIRDLENKFGVKVDI